MIPPRRLVGLAVLSIVTGLAAVPGAGGPPAHAGPAADAEDAGDGRMMLLLDASGSMAEPAAGGGTKIAAARTALGTVVDRLPDQAEVGLRVFGATVFSRTERGACTDSQVVVRPGTANRDELGAAIGDYEPYGETPIPHALRAAAQDLGTEGARSIVLVSDGESTCDPDPCRVAAELRRDGIDLRIDVVGLSVSGKARAQLRCIAEQGGGNYYDADSAADIESRLTRVASRAVRPFTLTGEPVEGGPAGAPTPVAVGEYVDTLGPSEESRSYVFTRETAGTTLRVAALSQGETGFADGLVAELTGPAGRCDRASTQRSALDLREVLGVQVTAGAGLGSPSARDCDVPGEYVVTLSRGRGAEETVPLGLVVTEEPPVQEVGFADPALADLSADALPGTGGRARAIEGAASLDAAPTVAAGDWSSTVVPGEVLLFRLPLEFGQAARVSVEFPEARGELAELFGRFPPRANLAVLNPLGAELGYVDGSTWLDAPDGTSLTAAVPVVSRAPSGVRGARHNGGADVTTAGDYHLSVSVQRRDYTAEIPFTLHVEVLGEPAAGPTYADGATWSVTDGPAGPVGTAPDPTAGPAGPDGDAAAARADEDGGASGTLLVTAVAAGAAAVGLAALVIVLLRRRRRVAG